MNNLNTMSSALVPVNQGEFSVASAESAIKILSERCFPEGLTAIVISYLAVDILKAGGSDLSGIPLLVAKYLSLQGHTYSTFDLSQVALTSSALQRMVSYFPKIMKLTFKNGVFNEHLGNVVQRALPVRSHLEPNQQVNEIDDQVRQLEDVKSDKIVREEWGFVKYIETLQQVHWNDRAELVKELK
ncbi:MAG: hypothetical protein JWO53_125 [Chlamydiia bacterium]|nr:hypothetical protein [Chlamydiia bacterium]